MNELTDRVPYCVVKANCPGPSFFTHHDYATRCDVWTCKQCTGTAQIPLGQMPERDRRTGYEQGSRL